MKHKIDISNILYKRLIEALVDNDWEISVDNELGFITAAKEDLYYILYPFGNRETGIRYIADESLSNGEKPIWYNEISYETSPVYTLAEHTRIKMESLAKEGLFRNPYNMVVVLMPPTYIANAEEVIDEWGWTKVVSYRRLIETIGYGGTLSMSSEVSDICGG